MSACTKCAYDPDALVLASWTFVVALDPPSLNAHIQNAGTGRWQYAKLRKEWTEAMAIAQVTEHVPIAAAKRRVTLTRLFSGRQKRRDRDNLAGGCKPIVDAMIEAGLLVDDDDEYAEIHYAQERGNERGLRVLIEEIA